jgi:glycosyltransferase involved in cell wall biosynthesis
MRRNKVVVVSEAGPPLGNTVAEGGSLRAWGIARTLADLGHEVTYLYRKGYEDRVDNDAIGKNKDITFATWSPIDKKDRHIHSADVIIVRQSHAEASVLVDQLENKQILVVDCYVPIHVEVSARESENKEQEYKNFIVDDNRWTRILARGDYFLYASDNQKLYLLGLLSGVLLLNPITYRKLELRLIHLPYCFFASDAKNRIDLTNTDASLLWYGGLYSWFDIGLLVPGLLEIKKKYPKFKFILAGAKNPYVSDKSLLDSYNQAMQKLNPIKDFLVEIPHEKYNKRFKTYAKSSAIVYINKEGLENSIAWRTRLVDYILAKKPIITNGGDPLGEDLINEGLAFRIDTKNSNSLLQQFEKSINLNIDSPYSLLLKKYSWESNVPKLSSIINTGSRLLNTKLGYSVSRNVKKSSARSKSNILIDGTNYYRSNGMKKTLKRIINR